MLTSPIAPGNKVTQKRNKTLVSISNELGLSELSCPVHTGSLHSSLKWSTKAQKHGYITEDRKGEGEFGETVTEQKYRAANKAGDGEKM